LAFKARKVIVGILVRLAQWVRKVTLARRDQKAILELMVYLEKTGAMERLDLRVPKASAVPRAAQEKMPKTNP
jgi:hypothetical protein